VSARQGRKGGFSNSKFTHTWPHLRPEFSLLCGVLGTRVLETKVLVLVSSLSQKFSWKSGGKRAGLVNHVCWRGLICAPL